MIAPDIPVYNLREDHSCRETASLIK